MYAMTLKYSTNNKIYCENCYKKVAGNGEIFTITYEVQEEFDRVMSSKSQEELLEEKNKKLQERITYLEEENLQLKLRIEAQLEL